VIAGATAVGGGDLMVVVDSDVVLLLDVESVTMGSAATARDISMTKRSRIAAFLIILLPLFCFYSFIATLFIFVRSAICWL
jgi:hypothetical protein